MSVVDRTRLWAEYKEKSNTFKCILYSIEIKEAKDKKERDDKVAQDCTFKPQINNNYGVVKRKTNR